MQYMDRILEDGEIPGDVRSRDRVHDPAEREADRFRLSAVSTASSVRRRGDRRAEAVAANGVDHQGRDRSHAYGSEAAWSKPRTPRTRPGPTPLCSRTTTRPSRTRTSSSSRVRTSTIASRGSVVRARRSTASTPSGRPSSFGTTRSRSATSSSSTFAMATRPRSSTASRTGGSSPRRTLPTRCSRCSRAIASS